MEAMKDPALLLLSGFIFTIMVLIRLLGSYLYAYTTKYSKVMFRNVPHIKTQYCLEKLDVLREELEAHHRENLDTASKNNSQWKGQLSSAIETAVSRAENSSCIIIKKMSQKLDKYYQISAKNHEIAAMAKESAQKSSEFIFARDLEWSKDIKEIKERILENEKNLFKIDSLHKSIEGLQDEFLSIDKKVEKIKGNINSDSSTLHRSVKELQKNVLIANSTTKVSFNAIENNFAYKEEVQCFKKEIEALKFKIERINSFIEQRKEFMPQFQMMEASKWKSLRFLLMKMKRKRLEKGWSALVKNANIKTAPSFNHIKSLFDSIKDRSFLSSFDTSSSKELAALFIASNSLKIEAKFHLLRWKNQAMKDKRREELLEKIASLPLKNAMKRLNTTNNWASESSIDRRIEYLETQMFNLHKQLEVALENKNQSQTIDFKNVLSPTYSPTFHLPSWKQGSHVSPALSYTSQTPISILQNSSMKDKKDEETMLFMGFGAAASDLERDIFCRSTISVSTDNSYDTNTENDVSKTSHAPIGPRTHPESSGSSGTLFAGPCFDSFDLQLLQTNLEEKDDIFKIPLPSMNPLAREWNPLLVKGGAIEDVFDIDHFSSQTTPSFSSKKAGGVTNGGRRSDEQASLIKEACRCLFVCYHYHLNAYCARGDNCKFIHLPSTDGQLLEKFEELKDKGMTKDEISKNLFQSWGNNYYTDEVDMKLDGYEDLERFCNVNQNDF
eukprot:CAMPEP_0171453304 /NCGR_PEP_ID=MMETSP0945-20130129/1068_1 /TAXON_ID=109269 /ORGANISM="Vaucheria litorea, Strain CCMP2940" /LENGTH=726 /DNA_ID=CAMNT_0011978149 /DNA_START=173 /DNA_END=2353 /DNA_ORIENTATION=+